MAKKATKNTSATTTKKTVETLTHDAYKRKNVPMAEFQSVVKEEQQQSNR